MAMKGKHDQTSQSRASNARILLAGLRGVLRLHARRMAYAAVPLYRLFCQVTGYNGTTQRVEQMSDRWCSTRPSRSRFDANVSSMGLPWEFKPETARNHAEDRRDRRRSPIPPSTAQRGCDHGAGDLQRHADGSGRPISTRSSVSASPNRPAEAGRRRWTCRSSSMSIRPLSRPPRRRTSERLRCPTPSIRTRRASLCAAVATG